MPANIKKLYLSHFLIGLIFWYGIEKLFMQGIGIDATGVGIVAAVTLVGTIMLDIPSGILADKWSRKGMLFVAVLAMMASTAMLGLSNSLGIYMVGAVLYSIYIVATSGTYQALLYDSLHEAGQSKHYSKIAGRAYALFLAGAGVANIASGFIANQFDLRTAFFVSLVPCVINLVVIASIKEPSFHKAEQKERMLGQLGTAVRSITSISLLFGLTIITTLLSVIELFKEDFGQLYMLEYINSAQLLGLLWAAYAFAWALGSLIAHRFRSKLSILVWSSVLPLVGIALFDSWVGLLFFMAQAVASAALINQIETRVQETTPSSVRASILSVLSTFGRIISVPASITLGWLITVHGMRWAVYAITVLGVCILFYWIVLNHRHTRTDKT